MIIPARTLNLTYIILDSIFLIIFVLLLILKKKYSTLIISLIGGVLYFIVDYVFFYHVSHSRVVIINGEEASELVYFFYLLWHELSAGITNFAIIWLALEKDKNAKELIFLVILWWFILPIIAESGGEKNIYVYRTTSSYHIPMAIILLIGYFILILYSLFNKSKDKPNIIYLFLVGFGVQFAWESAFLLYGIRTQDENSLLTLFIDSLIETNLGMPYFYFIHKFYKKFENKFFHKKEEVVQISE